MSNIPWLSILFYLPWGIIFVLLYLIFFHIERIELVVSKIYGYFRFMSKTFEKAAVSKHIRGTILSFTKELNRELKDIAPYDLKIQWVKEENKETFLKENQIILRMYKYDNQAKNVVVALTEYVEKGIMPKAKKYIHKNVSRATDLAITRKILISRFSDSLDYFDEEFLKPLLNDDELKETFFKIKDLDESGMLTQVVLREFIELGKKLYPSVPDENIKKETQEFINYLYEIATKEPGNYTNLCFNKGYIKVAVVLIANQETYNLYGKKPYPRRIKINLDAGIDTVYVIAPLKYRKLLQEVVNEIKRDDRIKGLKEFNYYYMLNRKKIKSICVALYTNTGLDKAS
ncbi:hypothetical protein ciss_07600 [Carboxydothermus islandicus]|uniref:Uncharacterized protein n=1 Tax=Carboxydothermus islandicus TaxID=661089 RepID=A0A1L8D130_9THEO|nr:hypothetical protein [Carboxydothermus islandicus]GAV24827.1 hypothetical protein ciss_07600 [Carboxydothermus islandicus]